VAALVLVVCGSLSSRILINRVDPKKMTVTQGGSARVNDPLCVPVCEARCVELGYVLCGLLSAHTYTYTTSSIIGTCVVALAERPSG